ncbi:hypothetical protein [Pararhizobium sp. IMCC21322]|uniref:hypothetical protein n=1 Tax=Pararhizobium sp. IMCC21322 TaxID=3067903 RepID=UPI0027416ADB|nr:hypothetical protein [Pararhizobium sp. IMCC21322]
MDVLRPSNDSRELVKHSRQMNFAMLLVVAIVTVGFLTQSTSRLDRAISQAETIQGMIGYIMDEVQTSQEIPNLSRLLLGAVPRADTALQTFDITFTRASPSPLENSALPTSLRCRATVDLSYYFYPDRKLGAQNINFTDEMSGEYSLLLSTFGAGGQSWSSTPRLPKDLAELEVFWNVFAETGEAVRMTNVKPQLAYAELYSGETDTSVYYVAESYLPVEEPLNERLVMPGLSQFQEYFERPDGEMMPDFLRKLPPMISEPWVEHDVDGFTQSECINLDATLWPGWIRIPAEYNYETTNWIGAWFEQSDGAGYVQDNFRPHREKFKSVFQELSVETSGLESLTFSDARKWLRTRAVASKQSVEVFGVEVPGELLRITGISLIVMMQLYTTIHLLEAKRRLAISELGDPGAFEPWIVLYDSPIARYAATASYIAPIGAAILVFINVMQNEGLESWGALIAALGLLVAFLLGSISTREAMGIRREAHRHRLGRS